MITNAEGKIAIVCFFKDNCALAWAVPAIAKDVVEKYGTQHGDRFATAEDLLILDTLGSDTDHPITVLPKHARPARTK